MEDGTTELQVGVDVGGTFTDVVLHSLRDGRVVAAKALSTPDAPMEGMLEGIRHALASGGARAQDIRFVRHGTTIATNAVLERRGAKTALLVTKGFRDILYVGRQARPSLYNLRARPPAPLVPRHLTFELDERMAWTGGVERPVDREEVRRIAGQLRAEKVQAVAVCLLHAYANGENERTTREILRSLLPEVAICLSSEICPEIGEYERASTTCVNAYVMPAVARYVDGLQGEVAEFRPDCQVYIMQSNGGGMGPELAGSRCVHTAYSGPAGGLIAAGHFARQAGLPNVITLDVGGTSADVAVIVNGQYQEAREGRIGGLSIRIPLLEIHSVGAGGGSIAWIDSGMALRVGPQSAGAVPGPICYRRGGQAPTVTDAHVVLGHVGAVTPLAGRVALDAEAAADGIRRAIAEPLGLSLPRAAAGIVEVVNATMARAIRVLTVERGHDPKDFVLVAFGGAGPLHAVALAKALGILTVAIPPYAGVLSGLGMLVANIRHDFVRTHIALTSALTTDAVRKILRELEEEALAAMRREGFSGEAVALRRFVAMRYVGQGFELTIPIPEELDQPEAALAKAFHAAHRRRYGFAVLEEPTEVVDFGVTAIAALPEFRYLGQHPASGEPASVRTSERPTWFAGDYVPTAVLRRDTLPLGTRLSGPAVLEGEDSTGLLPPGCVAEVETSGLLVIRPISEGGW